MVFEYYPSGACSKKMDIEVEDGILKGLKVKGGCNGNLKGIARLVTGMKVVDVIAKLKGVSCDGRGTSCPDQLAIALEEMTRQNR